LLPKFVEEDLAGFAERTRRFQQTLTPPAPHSTPGAFGNAAMNFSFSQVVVWIVIGLAGGTLAGMLVRRDRKGFGFFSNFALGLAGALIGGALFRILGILPSLDKISISARDIVSAVLGSLLVLLAYRILQKRRAGF
jgi:uncharacterized membrane protein YeaQ/YmgE (transglycosylase-associated protein family)